MRSRMTYPGAALRLAVAVCLVVLPDIGVVAAQEPAPSTPRMARVRIVGLFAPERVEALREAASEIEEASLEEVDYETAHAVFEFRSDKGWKDVPLEKLAERIDQALRHATHSTIAAAPASETPAERLTETEIAAYGCACKACELAAYESIAKIEGVERATVSFRDSRIVVRFDSADTNRDALLEALKQRGVALEPPAQ